MRIVSPRTTIDYKTIDFDREFARGRSAYDGVVGRWWHQRSLDQAHARADRNIVRLLRTLRRDRPRTILDYACGSGRLLARLYGDFPASALIGVDGSSLMLGLARRRLGHLDPGWERRLRLIETALPDVSLPREVADVVILAFPNLVATPGEPSVRVRNGFETRADGAVARALATARGPEPEDEGAEDAESYRASLLDGRAVARNLRQLVRGRGLCLRVEYTDANAERNPLTQLRSAFEEGSLDRPIDGRRTVPFFRLVRTAYFRSKVIEDVYQQTGDPTDRIGGYSIRMLEAV